MLIKDVKTERVLTDKDDCPLRVPGLTPWHSCPGTDIVHLLPVPLCHESLEGGTVCGRISILRVQPRAWHPTITLEV